MAAIKPACTGEPVTARINHGKASVETCDPMADTICPLHSSKKSRCRHKEAGRATAVGLPGFPALCTSGDGFCDRVMVRYFRSMQHRSFLSLLYLFFGQVSPTQNFVPGFVNDCQEDNWTARATARVARTIPGCPCYTSPCIVRATLAASIPENRGGGCQSR